MKSVGTVGGVLVLALLAAPVLGSRVAAQQGGLLGAGCVCNVPGAPPGVPGGEGSGGTDPGGTGTGGTGTGGTGTGGTGTGGTGTGGTGTGGTGTGGTGSGNPSRTDSTSGNRSNWAWLGAAGLGLVIGLPFSGAVEQGLPFAIEPAPMVPGVPTAAIAPPLAAAPGAVQGPVAAPAIAPVTSASARPATIAVVAPRDSAAIGRAGMIAPRTATHLPLLGALGTLMLGSGAWLVKRQRREHRRRRRRVLF